MRFYQQPDSTIHHPSTEAVTVPVEELPIDQHPYETLQQLPANATPSQADSALQAFYTSQRHILPTDSMVFVEQQGPAVSTGDSIPLYYKQTFFSSDSLLNSSLYGRMGVAGDPITYTLRSDDVLTPMVILLILGVIYSTKQASKFYRFQLRNFFRIVRNDSSALKEAASDIRNLLFVIFNSACILALVFFFYAQENIGETYITYSNYTLMTIFLIEVGSWMTFEVSLQRGVNKLFFTKQQCEQWTTAKLFSMGIGGLLLTPLLLFMVYFGQNMIIVANYAIATVFLTKLIAFYKAYRIFFGKMTRFLQFFLYLCTLEIVPALIAWGVLLFTANYLRVNY